MDFLKSFKDRIFYLKPENFDEEALALFHFQRKHNQLYNNYIEKLGINAPAVTSLEEIPFLPIDFYKEHIVKSGDWKAEIVFESSGTTSQIKSKHHLQDLDFYRSIAINIFENIYGNLDQFHVLALLPSYLERSNASLVFMVDEFIKKTASDQSGFYLNNTDQLINNLKSLLAREKKVLLIGVTYALLDLIDNFQFDQSNDNLINNNLIIMETGGMKGRRKEIVREELQSLLARGFKVGQIHSEYGMTELTSQAYALKNGNFKTPGWMKVQIREINDPFQQLPPGKTGGINIIDLANAASCAFIETKDLGKINDDGSFSVAGRLDNSDLRGCNLLIE